jgi:predicted GTPase
MTARAEVAARALAALDQCERVCPRDAAPHVAVRLDVLRAIVTRGAAPRVAAIGRRGAGKSSLLNALAGAPLARVGDVTDTTHTHAVRRVVTEAGPIEWLDTPGLRAGARAGRLDAVAAAAGAFEPTALLVLCAATEVDAGIDDDLDDVAAIVTRLARRPALIAASTRVDELAPPDVLAPPFDDDEKRANIARSVSTLHGHLVRRGLAPRLALPVCALTTWRGDALVDDARWNLAPLARALAATSPRRIDDDVGHLVRGLCDAVVDHVAGEAARVAMTAPAGRSGDVLTGLQGALVRCLDAVLGAFTDAPPRASREAPGEAARPGMFTEVLRGALDGIGARRAGAAVASGRVRALGRSVLAHEAPRPSAALLDAMGARD